MSDILRSIDPDRIDAAPRPAASRPHKQARNCHFADEKLDNESSIEREPDTSRPGDEQNPSWWSQTGSNRRPPACKAGALPTELWPHELGAMSLAL
jgi:hypothetical protein